MSESGQTSSRPVGAGRGSQPRRRLERRGAVVLVVLFAAAWVAFIFAGSFARASDLETRVGDARARTAALQAQVDAGYAEIEFIKTDAFLDQASRGSGFGTPDEQAFALPQDAPPPQALPIIGGVISREAPVAPLDAWLALLFGSDAGG